MPPKALCGNPLFLEWTEEIHRHSALANLQSAHAYRKAVASIRACPISYARPAQLVSLSHVGPKIIDILAKKQREWCDARGVEVPSLEKGSDTEWWMESMGRVPAIVGGRDGDEEEEDGGEDDFDQEMSGLLSGMTKKGAAASDALSNPRKRKTPTVKTTAAETFALFSDEDVPSNSIINPAAKKRKTATVVSNPDESNDLTLPATKTKTKASGKAPPKEKAPPKPKPKKVYIPKQNSGSYAILIGLVLELPLEILARGAPCPSDRIGGVYMAEDDLAQNDEDDAALDAHDTLSDLLSSHAIPKSDLIERAEPHCSSSFTSSEKGSAANGNFYTAWSNMKALMEKGYVGTRGNPKKYFLTVEGFRSGLGLWKTAFEDQAKELATFREENLGLSKYGRTSKRHEDGNGNAIAGPSRLEPGRSTTSFGNQRDLNQPSPTARNRSKSASVLPVAQPRGVSLSDDNESDHRPRRPGLNRLRSSSPDISMEDFGDDEIAAAEELEKDHAAGRAARFPSDQVAFGQKSGPHDALMRAMGRQEKSRGEQAIGGGLANSSSNEGRSIGGRTPMFTFWYLEAEDGNQVITRLKAKCRLDEELLRPMWLIRLDVRDLAHPMGRKLRHVKQSKGSGTIFEGYMLEGDAPERCTAAAAPVEDIVRPKPIRPRQGLLSSSPAGLAARKSLPDGFDFDEGPGRSTTTDPARSRPAPVKKVQANVTPVLAIPPPKVKAKKISEKPAPSSDIPMDDFELAFAAIPPARPRLGASRSAMPLGSSPLAPAPGADVMPLPGSSPLSMAAKRDRQASGRAVNVSNSRLLGLAPSARAAPVLAGSVIDAIDIIEIDDPPAPAPLPRPLAIAREGTWQRTVSAPEARAPGRPANAQAGPSRIMPRVSSAMPAQSAVIDDFSVIPQPVNDFTPGDAETFLGGSFDVILLLDTREVRTKRDEQIIMQGLLKKGILVETRMLAVGDMCWIARLRTDKLPRPECVLDYVCERKRLDDLIGSIHGGRYEEQKYRLTNSCLRHVYYIVEDWDVTVHKEQTGLAIATAKSQTQITDGFFLKDTHKLSETIDFLRMMSEVIKQAHEFETLHVIPDKFISRPTYGKFQRYLRHAHPSKPFYTTYNTYQELNGKNSCRILRDVFARMLLCIRGMSAERVGAVLRLWETPAAMWEAYDLRKKELSAGAGGPRQRSIELFFADAIVGDGRQKIGDALSREMHAVLCA